MLGVRDQGHERNRARLAARASGGWQRDWASTSRTLASHIGRHPVSAGTANRDGVIATTIDAAVG
jgi:hypothetical protein